MRPTFMFETTKVKWDRRCAWHPAHSTMQDPTAWLLLPPFVALVHWRCKERWLQLVFWPTFHNVLIAEAQARENEQCHSTTI